MFACRSSSARTQKLNEVCRKIDIELMRTILITSEGDGNRKYVPLMLHWNKPQRREELFAERQQTFRIIADCPSQTVAIEKGHFEQLPPQRCRLLYEDSENTEELNPGRVVIMNIHGGGYMGGSPDSHEVILIVHSRVTRTPFV